MINQGDGIRVSDLAKEVGEASNFATFFGGSSASQSTPHLYISSLATWSRDSIMSQTWKKRFSHVPFFEQTGDEVKLPLLSIRGKHRVSSIAFSSDGTRIVSGSDDRPMWIGNAPRIASDSDSWSVRVWDASTGAELKRLKGHCGFVCSVAFSSDGTRIVSGSWDK